MRAFHAKQGSSVMQLHVYTHTWPPTNDIQVILKKNHGVIY